MPQAFTVKLSDVNKTRTLRAKARVLRTTTSHNATRTSHNAKTYKKDEVIKDCFASILARAISKRLIKNTNKSTVSKNMSNS